MIQSASEKCTYVGSTEKKKRYETTVLFIFKCYLESLHIEKAKLLHEYVG